MRMTAKETIEQGRAWIEANPKAWQTLKDSAREAAGLHPGRELRIAYYIEMIRATQHVKTPNAIQPYLSRRIEQEVPGVRFTKSKSKLNLLMAGDA